MKKAYLPKPMSYISSDGMASKGFNTSDDFDAALDDAMLDDEDDDFLCSQLNLNDIPGIGSSTPAPKTVQPSPRPPAPRIQPQPHPRTPQFQPRPVTPQYRPSPSPYRPQTPLVARPPQVQPVPVPVSSGVHVENENSPESKLRDQLQGEILWLKGRLEIVTKQLEEERKSKQKIIEEREATLTETKSDYDKKLNNIQSKLDFKEHDYKQLKMKIEGLERQLKINQTQLDNQISSKPLPYSLPIVMHRSLNFTPNKGFVDWDDDVTFDDIPD